MKRMFRSIFQDFRGNLSWGRICSFVALVVAAIAQFNGATPAQLSIWLGVAVGNYTVSKISEASCVKSGESGTKG